MQLRELYWQEMFDVQKAAIGRLRFNKTPLEITHIQNTHIKYMQHAYNRELICWHMFKLGYEISQLLDCKKLKYSSPLGEVQIYRFCYVSFPMF